MRSEPWYQTMRAYFASGATLPLAARRQAISALLAGLRTNEAALLAALAADLGKSAIEAYTSELGLLHHEGRYLLKNLARWAKPRRVGAAWLNQPGAAFQTPQPLGMVLIIGPWNYPLQLMLAPLLGALAAGNVAVLKPSEFAPRTAQALAELIASTLPETLCRVIQGGPDRASELLTLAWGHIFFTGSSRVGRLVMQAAAATLSPVTLELGGKNPCIVLADADPRITAERIAWGKFLNAGQTCAAPDTCFVARPIFPKFLAALRTAIRTFYGPDPRQSPDYSRIAHPAHFDRLRAFVGKGTLLQGGDSDRASLYFAPTLLQPDPDADPTVLQEEIFGPILPLLPFDDLSEVRSRLEDWPVPLAAYIFSSQRRRALRVLNTLRCATAAINDTVLQIANPRLGFGGLGQSGFGAYRGHASFATFSHFQARWIKPQRPHLRLRFPPFRITLPWLKRFYDRLGG